MDLGNKIKQARLEAGLSQRQLCGDEITRNMLSQIENGSAHPSMGTLRYLASRLGKSVSYFLEEDAVTSPNQALMVKARTETDPAKVLELLAGYREPDETFDREKQLLEVIATLSLAEAAIDKGQAIYAAELLEAVPKSPYCAADLERRRLLLLAKAQPQSRAEICRALPSLDEELLLRARDALDRGIFDRAAALLDAAEDQESPHRNFLRGEVWLALQQYDRAAACYHKAEAAFPAKCAPRLEHCYREQGDFEKAYFYACQQRG